MNRFIWMLMMISVALLSAHCQGFYRTFDDFEDELIGPLDGQDDWYSSQSGSCIAMDPNGNANQVLCIPSESSTVHKSLLTEHTGVPDGTSRMMFMRIRVGNPQKFSIGILGISELELDDFAPEIGMTNSPGLDLRVWDGQEGKYEVLTQLSPDRWYNIWILIDASRNVYEIWLNDTPGSNASQTDKLHASDGGETFGFRSKLNSDLFTFIVKTIGGSAGSEFGPVYLDDIYLELSSELNLENPTRLDEPIAGDADLNECVNLLDFAALAGTWLEGPDPSITWWQGNFDYNDQVDLSDLILMAENWLSGCTIAPR